MSYDVYDDQVDEEVEKLKAQLVEVLEGFSETELGYSLGISQAAVSKLLAGKSGLSVRRLVQLCHAAGTTVEGLFTVVAEETRSLNESLEYVQRKCLEEAREFCFRRGNVTEEQFNHRFGLDDRG